MNEFYTIKAQSEGLYKEKGSKFLSFAFSVASESEIVEQLSDLRKKYHDARHHCYAYIIGLKEQQYRANDDGEPNHAAGDPILGQIRSQNLTNVLIVVVRYFGGTKLGVGGLIHAYKTAAELAIAEAKIEMIHSKTRFQVIFNYDETAQVERNLSAFQIAYEAKNYEDKCEYIGLILDESFDSLKEKFALMEAQIRIVTED